MKFVCLALLAFAIAVSAIDIDSSVGARAYDQNAVELLDSLREQIAAHGIASLDLDLEAAPTAPADRAISVSFKWSKVDVKNFLAWLVDQKANAGVLDSLLMNSAKGNAGQKKLSAKMRKMLKKLRALKKLPTAGQHGGLWWYKVQCPGVCNSGHILQACHKYKLKPACDHTAYSDGKCVNSNYNQGRHLSYPGHALEGWQNNFFPHTYLYAAMANGGASLQNTGSTHRWAHEHGNTVCVSSQKPKFSLLKKYRNRGE